MADGSQNPRQPVAPTADAQLLQLLASALKGNSGMSGLLGNLDNPLLAVLAGAYDPLAQQGMLGGGGGSLYQQYASSASTNPDIINSIVSSVEQGANPYEIEAQIDQLAESNPEFVAASGMAVDTLKNMAKEMQREYSTGQKNDFWSKAGLRNPADIYTVEDVPLPDEAKYLISSFQAPVMPAMQQRGEAMGSLGDLVKREGKLRRESLMKGASDDSMKSLFKRLALGEEPTPKELARLGGPATARSVQKQAQKDLPKMLNDSDYKPSSTLPREVSNIFNKLAKSKSEQENAFLREQAVREGVLRSYEKSGQTPLKDQLVAMTRLLSGAQR